jgi:hypothetical protein
VTAATPEAEARLGPTPLRPGTPLEELLALPEGPGGLEALLTHGRQVEATLLTGGRPHPVRVRALALSQGHRRLGWAVLLGPESQEAPEAEELFHGMWTREPGMKRLFRIVEKVARTESSVLVRGETGTGKELVANALHAISSRRKGPFRAINCAALPPSRWRASSSAMCAAPSPARCATAPATSASPTAAPSSWTRWPSCPWTCRPSCCACWRRAR